MKTESRDKPHLRPRTRLVSLLVVLGLVLSVGSVGATPPIGTGQTIEFASTATGVGNSFLPRPAGRSGCVTTRAAS